jgi:hypothetical protein
MLAPLTLAQAIARLQRSTEPNDRAILWRGLSLLEFAVRDGLGATERLSWGEVAQAFAQLVDDGWVRFDYQAYPNDPTPPPAFAFRDHHLQRCDNIRVTAEGWRALAAIEQLQALPLSGPARDIAAEADGGVEERDVFISHASEDKDDIARPLAELLRSRGVDVWFDEFELLVGDSLRAEIDRGLAMSRYGVVILSDAFFAKRWPQAELDGLIAREHAHRTKIVLPVWHRIEYAEVARYSPLLATRLASNTDAGVERVADDLQRAARAGTRATVSKPATNGVDDSSTGAREDSPAPRRAARKGAETRGDDPVMELRERAIHFLAEGDDVRMRELLRDERAFAVDHLRTAVHAAQREGDVEVKPDAAVTLEHSVRALLERRWSTLLPVSQHDKGFVAGELRWIAEVAALDLRLPSTARPEWRSAGRWAAWLLLWPTLALAVAERRFVFVREAWSTQLTDGSAAPLPTLRLDAHARRFAEVIETFRFGKKLSLSPAFHLAFMLADSRLISDRYSELLDSRVGDAPLSALSRIGDASVIVALLGVAEGEEVDHWHAGAQVEAPLLDALDEDLGLRTEAARALFSEDSSELALVTRLAALRGAIAPSHSD